MKKPLYFVAAALLLSACSRSDQQSADRELHDTGAKVKEELHKDAAFAKEELKNDAAFAKEQALKAREETKKGVAEIKRKVHEKTEDNGR